MPLRIYQHTTGNLFPLKSSMISFATYLLFLRTSFQLKFFRMTTEDHQEHGVLVPLHHNVSLYISAGILQVLSSCCNCALQSFTYAAGGADGWRRRRTRRTAPRGRAGGRLWRRRRRHRDGYCPSLRRRRRVHQRCRLQRFPRLTAEVGLGRVLRPGGPPLIAGPGRYMPGRAGSICNEHPDTDTEAWAVGAARER